VPTPGVYYVAPGGIDTPTGGSNDSPWASVQYAANTAPAGSTIYIHEGTYWPFVLRRSGLPTAPTQFLAFGAEKPVIDGRGGNPNSIVLDGVSWVTIRGMTVTGAFVEGQAGAGIFVNQGSHISLLANTVHGNKAFGIRLFVATDSVVEGNDVYGNAIGIQVYRGGEGIVIRGNNLHDNNQMAVNTLDRYGDDAGGEAVALVNSTGHVLIEHNNIWGNRAVSYDYGYDGSAFSVFAASNWTIRNNVTWDNRNILETGTDAARTPCDNGLFVRNLNYGATTVDRTVGMVLRCASNTLVANNTFAGMQYFVFDISNVTGTFGGSIEGLRILNNVVSVSTGKIYGIESAIPSSVVIDYNVVSNTGTGYFATIVGTGLRSLAAFTTATGWETHGIGTSPLFVSPSTNDYRLGPSSPAIDSGLAIPWITDGFNGVAPDRGYAETGGI
jgi:parallel beta-helix repeat protein